VLREQLTWIETAQAGAAAPMHVRTSEHEEASAKNREQNEQTTEVGDWVVTGIYQGKNKKVVIVDTKEESGEHSMRTWEQAHRAVRAGLERA
jgi:hypothetical protein